MEGNPVKQENNKDRRESYESQGVPAEDILTYIKSVLSQRKSALQNASISTTNPLDRLVLDGKIEEMDIVLSHLKVK